MNGRNAEPRTNVVKTSLAPNESNEKQEYWKHTQLTIDVVPGRGGMFSLEGSEGLRFLVRSRLFTEEEWSWLVAHDRV